MDMQTAYTIAGALIVGGLGFALRGWVSRQPLSPKGRILKVLAQHAEMLPNVKDQDAQMIAQAQARQAADAAALAAFKDAVSKL